MNNMWMESKELSKTMYEKCKENDLKDDQEKYWLLITDSSWAYHYCKHIKDRPEVYKHITNSRWVFNYCENIKDRPEVRKYI